MTDFEKILEVVNKLDKERFGVDTIKKCISGGAYIEVRRKEGRAEINFEFDEEGNLEDIWS